MGPDELTNDGNLFIIMWHELSLRFRSKNISIGILNRLLMVWENPYGCVRVCAHAIILTQVIEIGIFME